MQTHAERFVEGMGVLFGLLVLVSVAAVLVAAVVQRWRKG